jgi:hypothetical protein
LWPVCRAWYQRCGLRETGHRDAANGNGAIETAIREARGLPGLTLDAGPGRFLIERLRSDAHAVL